MSSEALFTVDWECWDSFRPWQKWERVNLIEEPTHYFLDLFRRHQIKAIFYCVGLLAEKKNKLFNHIKSEGHLVGDHSYFHSSNDARWTYPYRAPRWKGEKRLYSGGFWFRLMPYKWTKREVEKTGIFFVHPHDVMLEHPGCGLRTFDRRIGLKTSRDKLESLCREIKWRDPH